MLFEHVQSSTWCLAERVKIFDYQRDLPNLKNFLLPVAERKDIEIIHRWFSQDYLGFDNNQNLVTDG